MWLTQFGVIIIFIKAKAKQESRWWKQKWFDRHLRPVCCQDSLRIQKPPAQMLRPAETDTHTNIHTDIFMHKCTHTHTQAHTVSRKLEEWGYKSHLLCSDFNSAYSDRNAHTCTLINIHMYLCMRKRTHAHTLSQDSLWIQKPPAQMFRLTQSDGTTHTCIAHI